MQIEIYTREGCGFCDMAKTLLMQKQIKFTNHEIGVTVSREKVKEMFPTVKFLPLVLVDNRYIGGYNELADMLEGKNINVVA